MYRKEHLFRRSLVVVCLLVVPAVCLSGWVFEGSGYIHFEDGTVQEFERLSPFWSTDSYFQGGNPEGALSVKRTQTGAELRIEWDTVQEIVHLSSGAWGDGRVHVTLRNGQEGEFYLNRRLGAFRISYFDNFSGSGQEDQIESENISRIVFGEDFGNARVNPSTGRIWPRSYRFDPYTGEQLEWVEDDGHSLRLYDGQDIVVRPEYDFVDTDIRVPGFSANPVAVEGEVRYVPDETDTELEDAVVDYSTTFMNPFSTSEEVTGALNRLRDEVIGE